MAIIGTGGSTSAKVIADVLKEHRQGLVIVSGRSRSEKLAEDLSFFCDKEVLTLPEDEYVFVKYEAKNQDQEIDRAIIINKIIKGEDIVIVAPASGAIKRMIPKEAYDHKSLTVSTGKELPPNEFKKSLSEIGFERVNQVYSPGQYSARGGIVDVYPLDSQEPFRIEYFGDIIESIRTFDIDTQRSIEGVESILISPIMSKDNSETNSRPGSYEYIWDYINNGVVFIEEPDRIREHLDLRYKELWNDLEYLVEKDQASFSEGDMITGIQDLERVYDYNTLYILQPFSKKIEGIDSLNEIVSIKYQPVTKYQGHMDLLARDIENYLEKGVRCVIVSGTENRMSSLKDFIKDQGYTHGVSVVMGSLSSGMYLPNEGVCYISDRDIFDNTKISGQRKRKRRRQGQPLKSFSELKKGEYVVHDNHGIGIYQGIEEVNDQGIPRDYIKIKYQGKGVLYVPVEQMDIVQKYIGNEGKPPKINKLGSDEWRRTRERARNAINDMTDELVELYAKRKAEGGYAFAEDTVWQKEFEDSFPYEETQDQLQSIEEIKKDMEKDEPMDRLLCGDVGYGKTEVAARGIFKCLIEGKQAAMLVPTTILASQHYDTLKERFKNYPFEIELMSRFKSDGELKETAQKLKKGKVDLLIGTHRILSEDVEFKDLGLLVVDEEQRFGVAHKEKIKKLKAGVDVLTLSATPIPRTLNMSLTGIRDMSLISEPPEERYPVQTYVVEQDDDLIREVINRELDRGGQVFVVFNRVRGIINVANSIRSLVPDARVAVGHGQMSENALEDVMKSFVAGEIDVLVATTIVESGLDIPNANTLIVLDSDKCGLSQLYQLRGRVGRSNRIAYAYLMYKKEKVLTEIAEKRLRAIREFTEFGAGFKIAMRDMELRGAGNILGAQQSGHMMDVGYELYARMVDEASRRARGETVKPKNSDISIELKSVANIPSWYIEDEGVKLAIYKRIADIESDEEADDVRDELADRFGDIPKETENLIMISRIRELAQNAHLDRIHEQNGKVYLTVSREDPISPYAVMKVNQEMGDAVTFYGGRIPYFAVDFDKKNKLERTKKVLGALVEGLGT